MPTAIPQGHHGTAKPSCSTTSNVTLCPTAASQRSSTSKRDESSTPTHTSLKPSQRRQPGMEGLG